MGTWLLAALAVISGALLPFQAGMNARMKVTWGHSLGATLVNFIVGLVALVVLLIALRVPWPGTAKLAEAPWWAWIGGLFGMGMVAGAIFLTPKLGVAGYFAAMVAGSMLAAVVIDHFGWLELAPRELNATKLLGAGLLIAGVVLVNWDR